MTEQYKDTVFFSRLFKTDYPDLYRQIEEILKESNIPHGFLNNTKDYWCRDYMPIQFGYNQFAQFVYRPDYLTGKDVYITDTDKVLKNLKIDIDVINKCQLVLDGGNYVCCECYEDKTCSTSVFIIMTEKVMSENPNLSKKEIEGILKSAFAPCNIAIVWLPWDRSDICGHTDGMLRFINKKSDNRPAVLTNLKVYDESYAESVRKILNTKFEEIELKLSHYDKLSWAYINALQLRDVILVPGIGDTITDNEALEQFKLLFPQYGNKIYQIQMRDFISKWDGGLNCCSWSISKEMSACVHNEVNDSIYRKLKDIATTCEGNEIFNKLSEEQIRFMGDYYPLKLQSVSPALDRYYWGF